MAGKIIWICTPEGEIGKTQMFQNEKDTKLIVVHWDKHTTMKDVQNKIQELADEMSPKYNEEFALKPIIVRSFSRDEPAIYKQKTYNELETIMNGQFLPTGSWGETPPFVIVEGNNFPDVSKMTAGRILVYNINKSDKDIVWSVPFQKSMKEAKDVQGTRAEILEYANKKKMTIEEAAFNFLFEEDENERMKMGDAIEELVKYEPFFEKFKNNGKKKEKLYKKAQFLEWLKANETDVYNNMKNHGSNFKLALLKKRKRAE